MWCTSPGRGGWRCRAPSANVTKEKDNGVTCNLESSAGPGGAARTGGGRSRAPIHDAGARRPVADRQAAALGRGRTRLPAGARTPRRARRVLARARRRARRARGRPRVRARRASSGCRAAGSPLSPVAAEAIEFHALVRAITDRIAQVSETARERMDRIAERDAVSQDVLIDVARTLEHQRWTLRAQLSDRARGLSHPASSRP